jgi:hypothetical protein
MGVLKCRCFCVHMSHGRNAVVVDVNACREFNICPICWMPLYIDRSKPEDELWGYVQYIVKGKPAFSIKASGNLQGRHVLAFGKSELNSRESLSENPGIISNCQDCHYIDVSLNAVSDAFFQWDNVREINKLQSKIRGNDVKDINFLKNLNIDDGLWAGGVFDFVCEPIHIEQSMRCFVSNNVFGIVSKTFSGCPDCNMKMTNNNYITLLFNLLFLEHRRIQQRPPGRGRPPTRRPSSAGARRVIDGDAIPKETQMYYIILSGMLKKDNLLSQQGEIRKIVTSGVNDAQYCYCIPDQNDRLTWGFRYIILWCLIKIMICEWADSEITEQFRHHISYLYEGIQDFYLSLLFFVMHSSNGKERSGEFPLRFDVFHFFYASHLPFFLNSQNPYTGHQKSISRIILKDLKMKFNLRTSITDIRNQFTALKEAVKRFWDTHFRHFSDFLWGKGAKGNPYADFFCIPAKAMRMSEDCKDFDMDIQTFKDFFTSYPGYWFHFKNITMPRVEKYCRLYYQETKVPFVKRVWAQWYAYLCICVGDLGKPNEPAVRMVSHYLLPPSSGKSLHLTARVLQSLVPEGGRRWCVRIAG